MLSPEVSKIVGGYKSPTQNLTGPARKLRDRCVDFLNCLTKQTSLNRQGQKILNDIFGVYKKHDSFPDADTSCSDFEMLQDSMEKLKCILQDIKQQVDSMSKITNVLHEQLKMEIKLKTPQFFDMNTQEVCSLLQRITDKQFKNYNAKKLALSKLLVQDDSQDIFFLLSLWVKDPYNGGGMEREVEDLKGMVVDYNKG